MASKFDLAQICRRAWQNARSIARGNNSAARAFLKEGFRNAWRTTKIEIASREAAPLTLVLPREACATRAQVSYIESLLGRGKSAPAGMTKIAASKLIETLKARKNMGLRSEDPTFDYGWY